MNDVSGRAKLTAFWLICVASETAWSFGRIVKERRHPAVAGWGVAHHSARSCTQAASVSALLPRTGCFGQNLFSERVNISFLALHLYYPTTPSLGAAKLILVQPKLG